MTATEPHDLAIIGATIIADATTKPIEGGAILVRDGRIVEIGPRPAAPIASRRTIDARGMVAIPGLNATLVEVARKSRQSRSWP